MKTKFLFFALFLMLAAPGFSQATDAGRSDDEQQIRKIEQEWLQAIVKRDAAYLQKLEVPDFTLTGPSGRTLNKEEDIKGKEDSGTYSWTDFCVKMNGEWKAVSGHVTVVAPEKK